MKVSERYMLNEAQQGLEKAKKPLDAYSVAKASGMLSATDAGRALEALAKLGTVKLVSGEGENSLAWTYELV